MNHINEQLLSILKEEYELYLEEAKKTKEKLDAINSNNLTLLSEVTSYEEKLIVKIRHLEKQREKIVESTGKKRLIDYIDSVDDKKFAEEALEIRQKMIFVIAEITDNNEFSSKLINISNGILNKVVDEITGRKDLGYKKDRQKSNMSNVTILNKKI